ncbi:hypothetical protein HZS_3492 [Henneguya salminicola]|nr:hypothetical protein HZS_3492 [Henneguya salminicola]
MLIQIYTTNYVKVDVTRKNAYKYSVTFSPDIDSTGLRYKLLCQHDSVIGDIKIFDGITLYVSRRLPEDSVIEPHDLPCIDYLNI